MSEQRTIRILVAAAIATCLLALMAMPAGAAPLAAKTTESRARVDSAVKRLEAARQKAAEIEAQVAQVSTELDAVMAQEQLAQGRLTTRAREMYRLGDISFVEVLLGAEDFQDFTARWDLLVRMNRQDAIDLIALGAARADAQASASSLLALQTEQARAVDAVEAEVARARQDLAKSEAALKEYEARIAQESKKASATQQAPTSTPSDGTPQVTGSGPWETAVASHYGRSFTGRGASGKRIGPYSMIVAHKTLPFGTLVEIEYNGRRAVASVEDRGPFTPGRTFDLGPGIVRALGFSGVHEVRYRVIGR